MHEWTAYYTCAGSTDLPVGTMAANATEAATAFDAWRARRDRTHAGTLLSRNPVRMTRDTDEPSELRPVKARADGPWWRQ